MDSSVAIIGLGYVGLPLGLAFLDAGCRVVGYEENPARLAELRAGRSPVDDVSTTRLADAIEGGLRLCAPDDDGLGEVDAIFVCVSTPIDEKRDPDLRAVIGAARTVSASLRPDQMVILQSTTWPGTTSGPFREELERSGLIAGRDFALAYAPERTNPGDRDHPHGSVPRLVGGLTAADTARAATLLRRLGTPVHELSSAEAAEMAKLLENVFRNVNIALVNQLALLCEQMGLDVWEVIGGAATKPFGFMPFRPGPGVGGHCIPVDPYYLAWRSRQFGLDDRFVELAGDINKAMPRHVGDLAESALAEHGKPLEGARIGLIGVAFKPNVRDTRNAPAGFVMEDLAARGAVIAYHDPLVESYTDAAGAEHASRPLGDLLTWSDLVIVVVNHDAVDWQLVYRDAALVVDTVDSAHGREVRERQVLRLGAGWAAASSR